MHIQQLSHSLSTINRELKTKEISLNELKDTIELIGNNKASGPDEIPSFTHSSRILGSKIMFQITEVMVHITHT